MLRIEVGEIGNYTVSEVCRDIEQVLYTKTSLKDCAVRFYQMSNGKTEQVAFVVLDEPFSSDRLASYIRNASPDLPVPSSFIPISVLPLDDDGQIDEEALRYLAQINESHRQQIETELQKAGRGNLFAIEMCERDLSLPPLRRSRLAVLPGQHFQTEDTQNDPMVVFDRNSRQPAISYGGDPQIQPDAPIILPDVLQKAAQDYPGKTLTSHQTDNQVQSLTYRELYDEACKILGGLRGLNLKPGDKIILQIANAREYVPAFWACVLGGFIPAPLTVPKSYEQMCATMSKLKNAWKMLERPTILTEPVLADGLTLAAKLFGEELPIAVTHDLRAAEPVEDHHPCKANDPTLFLFTSGSTGMPKTVVLTHKNILSMYAGTVPMCGFNSSDVSLNWMPLDHVGSVVFFSIMPIYLGASQVHVPTDMILRNPLKWLDLVDEYHASISWAPNFAFSLITAQKEAIRSRSWDLSSMRFLVNAGEAVVAKTVREFLTLLGMHGLPDSAVRPSFGMSETCSSITWSHTFNLANTNDKMPFVDLGPAIPGASMRIVDNENQVLNEGQVGSLQVSGPSVTHGYYNNDELNKRVYDGKWFNTGDLGFIKDGSLVLTGRRKDQIVINGINYHSFEIEAAVEETEHVTRSYTAACAVRSIASNTDKLALFFCTSLTDPQEIYRLTRQIRGKITQDVGISPNYVIPLNKEDVPKTAIGKIQRSKLANMFQNGGFDDKLLALDFKLDEAEVILPWFYTPYWRSKTRPQTQRKLGEILLVADGSDLSRAVADQLKQADHPVVEVLPGKDFTRLGTFRYRLDLELPAHVDQLLEAVNNDEAPFESIIYLPAETTSQGQGSTHPSALNLLHLVKNMGECLPQAHLLVVSDSHRAPADKGALLGLLKTIPHEYAGFTCHYLELEEDTAAQNATRINYELTIQGDLEVAYRKGRRMVRRLKSVQFNVEAPSAEGLVQGEPVLITGGLGDLGIELAAYLLKTYDSKLLIIGRTDLNEQSDATTTRQKNLHFLSSLGDVIYRAVDVCNGNRLTATIEAAEKEWGAKLKTVFHLAGSYHDRPLKEENEASLNETMRSKVNGARTLLEALNNHNDLTFVAFSSAYTLNGSAGCGAFTAASRCLEECAALQAESGMRFYTLSWALWDKLGISKDYPVKDLARIKGYHPITPDTGMFSIAAILQQPPGTYYIGLDSAHRSMRHHMELAAENITQWVCYHDLKDEQDLPQAKLTPPLTLDFVQLKKMPLTSTGDIDRRQLGREKATQAAGSGGAMEARIAEIWQSVLNLDQVGLSDNFFEIGGNSILLVRSHAQLQKIAGSDLELVDLFKYPTVRALAKYLSERGDEQSAGKTAARRAAFRREQAANAADTDIAVIGMACRFPGSENLDDFWELLRDGKDGFVDYSEEDLLNAGIDPKMIEHPDYIKSGPALDNIEMFDANFFGLNENEAALMDPQIRLGLEVAWETMENAGYNPVSYPGAVGVIAGAGMNTYLLNNVYPNRDTLSASSSLQAFVLDSMGGFQAMINNDKDYLPTRISHRLNLTGPSVNVQSACSTTLLTMHLGCQSLMNGECDMVICGGVSIKTPERAGYLYQEGMLLAKDGRCHAFDAKANGTVFGNGAGFVLLKPLKKAIAERDHIWGVVKGTAVSNDGAVKVGYTAPSQDGQTRAIAEAIGMADISPESISFVEMHGTATEMGDPIEVRAMTQAFRIGTDKNNFCPIGSVKTNLGHMQIASGVAGFMKTVLALHHRQIPASLNYSQPNPQINFAETPFYVNTHLAQWQADGPLRAGVNSLGIGGTNVHVILEEAPQQKISDVEVQRPQHLFPLSAMDIPALRDTAQRYLDHLRKNPDQRLADICFTAGVGREHFKQRLALICRNKEELAHQLEAFLADGKNTLDYSADLKVAFVFAGEGAQYAGMGRELYETQPTFKDAINACDTILEPLLKHSLPDLLFNSKDDVLNTTLYMLPCLFAFEYAMARLWLSWGIRPALLVGHGIGEYVAACIAEVFSLEDALHLIQEGAGLIQKLPQGAMLSVCADEDTLTALIEEVSGTLAISAVNSSSQCVLSGTMQEIQRMDTVLQSRGLVTRRLSALHAFHSPLLEPVFDAFHLAARRITYCSPQIPIVSGVTGNLVGEEIADPDYWVEQISQPVRFAEALKAVADQGIGAHLEIGSKGWFLDVLSQQAALTLPSADVTENAWDVLLNNLGRLYKAGAEIDWAGFDKAYTRSRVPLPTYAFQRKRYWIEMRTPYERNGVAAAAAPTTKMHPLLDRMVRSPLLETVLFETQISTISHPYLQEHRIFDKIVVPAANHISLLLGAAAHAFDTAPCEIRDIIFPQALILSDEHPKKLHLSITRTGNMDASFELIGYEARCKTVPDNWDTHALGKISPVEESNEALALTDIRSRCPEEIPGSVIYDIMTKRRIDLGPAFRWIDRVWKGNGSALCRMKIDVRCASGTPLPLDGFELHPGLIDSFLQVLLGTFESDAKETLVPVAIERFRYFGRPCPSQTWCYATLRSDANATDEFSGDLTLIDSAGNIIAAVLGFKVNKVSSQALLSGQQHADFGLRYEPTWVEIHPDRAREEQLGSKHWVIWGNETDTARQVETLFQAAGAQITTVADKVELFAQLKAIKENEDVRILYFAAPAKIGHNAQVVLDAFDCAQTIARKTTMAVSHVYMLTQNARHVQESDTAINLAHAPVWGIGQVLDLEIPNLEVGCIDLPAQVNPADIENLGALLLTCANERTALRFGKCYAERLKALKLLNTRETTLDVTQNGTVLITGGLGGLGLATAEGFLAQGVKHFALVSRNGDRASLPEAVTRMEAGGAQVSIIKADIADISQVKEVMAKIRRTMPPLIGVIHAAGILDDGLLDGLSRARFERVLAPKVQGSWNLHCETQDLALEFFVMYSSISALLGAPAQSNYAAANCFMDALASHRRMQNLPALSVQWGPWDQVGLAAALSGRNRQRMAEMGLTPLDANLGLQALFALLAEQKSAISSIVDVDWKDYPIDRHRGYLDAFLQPKERSTPRNQSFLAQIKAEPDPTTQWELLTAHVIEKIHRIIGISPDMVELRTGLFDLGLDSLMAVELKTHLEKSFECSLPATISFDYPTAKALINHLGKDVVGLEPAKAEEKEAETELLAETKDELVAILEAELDSL